MRWLVVVFGALAAAPLDGWAFPEMVRKGYNNCSVCHFSPTGGGVLRKYGRELSREELSRWGKEGEEQFLYGALGKLPNWVNFGGDIRAVQTYKNNDAVRQGRFIVMQLDLDTAVTVGRFTGAGTIGIEKVEKSVKHEAGIASRRHWLNYRPTDEVSLRGGKFLPAFGINVPDHIIPTKRGINWDAGNESYNLEAGWIGEQINLFATAIFGRPDNTALNREKGGAFSVYQLVSESYKLGASFYYGFNSTGNRTIVGPNAILGFTPSFFLLTEWDFVSQNFNSASAASQQGIVGYQRLDYELTKGLHTYVTQEYSQLNFDNSNTFSAAYGVGLQFFPRPHLELNMSWQKQKQNSVSRDDFGDYGWLMMHFYL
jgi:hypothetical protein